jgi:hypothetical protein
MHVLLLSIGPMQSPNNKSAPTCGHLLAGHMGK